jgi:hypothetical protein
MIFVEQHCQWRHVFVQAANATILDIKEFCARFFKFTCEKSEKFSFNFLLFPGPLDHQVFDFWSTVISDAEPNRTGGPRTAFLSYVYSLRSVAVPSS